MVINCPEEYELVSAVCLGKEAVGEDISILSNFFNTGITLTNNLVSSIRECDVLLISDISCKRKVLVNMHSQLLSILYEAIEIAIQLDKDIFYFSQLEIEKQKKYVEIAEKKGLTIKFFTQEFLHNNDIMRLKKINAPIIFVGEMLYDCDGYVIFTKLINEFKRNNLKVMAISEDRYNVLYGQFAIQLMDGLKPEESVFAINNYVSNLEKKIQPDVILVKIPQPMNAYNDVVSFDFGVSAYIISKALHADYLIYCGLLEYCNSDFISSIAESFSYKLGIPTTFFHFSNQIEDVTDQIKERIASIHLPLIKVVKQINGMKSSLDWPIFNLIDSKSFQEFYMELKEDLFDYKYGVVL